MDRRRSVSSRVEASTPSIRIFPLVGSMSRLTIFRLVVLPQPDGPTRTQILPAGIVIERSFTAPGVDSAFRRPVGASYRFVTWSNSTTAALWRCSAIGDPVLLRYAGASRGDGIATVPHRQASAILVA